MATILRGQLIYESDRLHGEPQGTMILRLDETESLPNGLERLNNLSQGEALEVALEELAADRRDGPGGSWPIRPFSSLVDLLDAADGVWATLDRADRQEAFAAHPRVSDREALRSRAFPSDFPEDEPSRLPGSPAAVLDELARADRDYEAKFDFIFIVARADLARSIDVLALLRQRLHNDQESELRIACFEQAEIARQRLRNLISGS